uniref:Uncharacterized protein n=1 Tax=Glossina pallidipes TaxID=7398 RepID=A0A1B0A564_GLOPL
MSGIALFISQPKPLTKPEAVLRTGAGNTSPIKIHGIIRSIALGNPLLVVEIKFGEIVVVYIITQPRSHCNDFNASRKRCALINQIGLSGTKHRAIIERIGKAALIAAMVRQSMSEPIMNCINIPVMTQVEPNADKIPRYLGSVISATITLNQKSYICIKPIKLVFLHSVSILNRRVRHH